MAQKRTAKPSPKRKPFYMHSLVPQHGNMEAHFKLYTEPTHIDFVETLACVCSVVWFDEKGGVWVWLDPRFDALEAYAFIHQELVGQTINVDIDAMWYDNDD